MLIFVVVLVGAMAGVVWSQRYPDCEVVIPKVVRKKEGVVLDDLAPFALPDPKPTLQIPDLSGEVVYFGPDERPDHALKLFHFKVGDEMISLEEGERAYLHFDKVYRVSPEETMLWFAPKGKGIVVGMQEMRNEVKLPKKELPRGNFSIDGLRVDGSLLVRQRVKWHGEDLFLREHGGEEFADARGRERLDIGEMHCFVGEGEGLIWKEGRWQRSEETLGYPLLWVRAIDDQMMHLEVWDAEGRAKVPLNLMRSKSVWPKGRQGLRFVAAKTWSQFVLDAGNQRIEVGPGDWLLLDSGKWSKIASIEEVDAYVAMQLTGELLVIEGLARAEGKRVLVGHLFNRSRTGVEPMEIPLSTLTTVTTRVEKREASAKRQEIRSVEEVMSEVAAAAY